MAAPVKYKITARGKTESLLWWSKEVGIHRSTLKNRIKLGWDHEQAISLRPDKQRRKCKSTFTVEGVTLTMPEWAFVNGLSTATMWGRRRRGWTPVDVINSKRRAGPRCSRVLVEHEGDLLSVPDIAKRIGLSHTTIYNRIRRGWDAADVMNPKLFTTHLKDRGAIHG